MERHFIIFGHKSGHKNAHSFSKKLGIFIKNRKRYSQGYVPETFDSKRFMQLAIGMHKALLLGMHEAFAL